jgi:hypothetical protein
MTDQLTHELLEQVSAPLAGSALQPGEHPPDLVVIVTQRVDNSLGHRFSFHALT